MATLFNQYRHKRKELTAEVIDELTDRMELINAEKLNKLSLSTKMQKAKLEEKNYIDVELEKETYNIVLAKKLKALTRKREIPLKIANNESIEEQQKAGFIINPFSNESVTAQDAKVNTKPLSKMDIVKQLFSGIEEREDNKLTSKTSIIDTENRTEDRHYKEVMEILKSYAIVKFKRGHGYYALKGYSEAIEAVKGAK